MKKQFIAPIAAASAAALLACGVSAAPAVAGRKTCEAYIADITLDGKIDDAWNYAPGDQGRHCQGERVFVVRR